MNFKDIKSRFLQYLQNEMLSEGKDPKNIELSAKSIFMYQDDFKNFLKEELNISDRSVLTISVSDILKMNAMDENNPETFDANEENSEESAEDEETQDEDGNKNNWLKEFVKELLGDKDIKAKVDKDKNNDINDEELNNFLDSVKKLDGDENTISLDDLFKTYEGIQDGTFLNDDNAETPEETQGPETPETPDNSSTKETPNENSSNGTNSPNSYNNTTGTDNNQIQNGDDGSVENMSEEKLNQEKNTAQSDIDTNQSILQSIADGTYSGDSEFADMKNEMDEAYKNYTEALDKEENKELKQVLTDIQKTENQIAQKEADISQQKTTVENAKTTSENAQTTFESMDAAYKALVAQKSSKLTSEESTELNGKIAAAKARRDEAEREAQKAKEDYETEKGKLSDIEKELDELKTGENGLDKLNAKKETLEANIDKESETGKLMTEYNTAKAKYDAKKSDLQIKAKEAIDASQQRLNEVNKALNTKKDEKEISDNYKFSATSDLFDSNVKMTRQMVTDEKTGMQYYLMAPEGTDPTKDELPMILYLHGGDGGIYDQSLFESVKSSPGVFLKDTNFKGYIVCPVLPAGNRQWDDPNVAANLDNFLTSFSSSHKVKQDKIALAGVSLGGSGTLYMANSSLKKWFCKAAAISPARGQIDTSSSKIPLKIFFGSNDDQKMFQYYNDELSKYNDLDVTFVGNHEDKNQWVTHTWAAAKSFELDKNNNGYSDLIEWFFT